MWFVRKGRSRHIDSGLKSYLLRSRCPLRFSKKGSAIESASYSIQIILGDGVEAFSRRNLLPSPLSRFVDTAQTLLFSSFYAPNLELFGDGRTDETELLVEMVWFSVYINSYSSRVIGAGNTMNSSPGDSESGRTLILYNCRRCKGSLLFDAFIHPGYREERCCTFAFSEVTFTG